MPPKPPDAPTQRTTPDAPPATPPKRQSLKQHAEKAGVKDEIGEEFEVFAHGTTRSSAKEYVEMQGQNLSARAGNQDGRFYTALDQGVAEEFAARSASKVGDEAALIGIALPKSVVKRLRDQKLIKTIKIDDRSGLQTVFEPGALKILQVEGFFFHID